jgi:hypothetical protein
MKLAWVFAALAGVVIGMLIPGRDSLGLYLLVLASAAVWRYGLDWSELKAERRTLDEPVVRERRRRDFEVGR